MCGGGCIAHNWRHWTDKRCRTLEVSVQRNLSLQGSQVSRDVCSFTLSDVDVRKKIQHMMSRAEHLSVNGATIILVVLLGLLLGLRRSEHFASAELRLNAIKLLRFRNFAGASWDLGDCNKTHNIEKWSENLTLDEII